MHLTPGLHRAMEFITDFADTAVLLPLAVLVGFWLWEEGWQRGLRAWALVMGLGLGTVAVLKLLSFSLGMPLRGYGVTSPSGHVAASVLVYGGAGVLLFGRRPLPAAAMLAGLLLLLVGIGVTRLAVGMHTVGEVLAGSAIGLVGLLALRRSAGPAPEGLRLLRLLLPAALLVTVQHGERIYAEAWLRRLGAFLHRLFL